MPFFLGSSTLGPFSALPPHSVPASPALPHAADHHGPTKRPSFIRSLSHPASRRPPQAEGNEEEPALVRKPSAVLLRQSGESEVVEQVAGKGGALGVRIPSATLFGPEDMSAEGLLSPSDSDNGPSIASSLQSSPLQPYSATSLQPSSSQHISTNTHRHSSNASLSSLASYTSPDGLQTRPTKLRVPDTPRPSSTDLANLPSSSLGSSYGLIPLLPADRRNSVSGPPPGGDPGGIRMGGVQDPRDHSVLEHIYAEMHAERFINLAPLSLLANSLPLYFKGTPQIPME